MKITDNFMNQSIMNEIYFEYGLGYGIFDDSLNFNDDWKEIIIEWCEPAKKRIDRLHCLIKNLNN